MLAYFKFIALCAAVIFLPTFFASWQRQTFGGQSGNELLGVEVVSCALAGVAIFVSLQGRRSLGIALAAFVAAGVLGFAAWFVHPEQVMSRAEERLADIERAASELRDADTVGVLKDSAVRFRRLATERNARRFEYYAAVTRYRGDPPYFRSSFSTALLGGLAVVAAMIGLASLREHCGRVSKREA